MSLNIRLGKKYFASSCNDIHADMLSSLEMMLIHTMLLQEAQLLLRQLMLR